MVKKKKLISHENEISEIRDEMLVECITTPPGSTGVCVDDKKNGVNDVRKMYNPRSDDVVAEVLEKFKGAFVADVKKLDT